MVFIAVEEFDIDIMEGQILAGMVFLQGTHRSLLRIGISIGSFLPLSLDDFPEIGIYLFHIRTTEFLLKQGSCDLFPVHFVFIKDLFSSDQHFLQLEILFPEFGSLLVQLAQGFIPLFR